MCVFKLYTFLSLLIGFAMHSGHSGRIASPYHRGAFETTYAHDCHRQHV